MDAFGAVWKAILDIVKSWKLSLGVTLLSLLYIISTNQYEVLLLKSAPAVFFTFWGGLIALLLSVSESILRTLKLKTNKKPHEKAVKKIKFNKLTNEEKSTLISLSLTYQHAITAKHSLNLPLSNATKSLRKLDLIQRVLQTSENRADFKLTTLGHWYCGEHELVLEEFMQTENYVELF